MRKVRVLSNMKLKCSHAWLDWVCVARLSSCSLVLGTYETRNEMESIGTCNSFTCFVPLVLNVC